MLNALITVLLRFQKEPVAISCDIEKTFFQFKVQEIHRDFLRFLLWPKGDLSAEPAIFRMTVYVFGAVSSNAVAVDGKADFGKEAADRMLWQLVWYPTPEAISLVSNTKQLCAKFGIRLHKLASHSLKVLQSIPTEERAKGIQKLV